MFFERIEGEYLKASSGIRFQLVIAIKHTQAGSLCHGWEASRMPTAKRPFDRLRTWNFYKITDRFAQDIHRQIVAIAR